MPVPPGLDDKAFQRALTRFKSVTGDAWVFTSAEDLALYKDAYSPLWNEQDEKVASAAVPFITAPRRVSRCHVP